MLMRSMRRSAPGPGDAPHRRRAPAARSPWDGKTVRGSGAVGGPGRHLLATLDHAHGVVLGQVNVEAKTNGIPMFAALLDRVDQAGRWSPQTRYADNRPQTATRR